MLIRHASFAPPLLISPDYCFDDYARLLPPHAHADTVCASVYLPRLCHARLAISLPDDLLFAAMSAVCREARHACGARMCAGAAASMPPCVARAICFIMHTQRAGNMSRHAALPRAQDAPVASGEMLLSRSAKCVARGCALRCYR